MYLRLYIILDCGVGFATEWDGMFWLWYIIMRLLWGRKHPCDTYIESAVRFQLG